MPVLPANKVTGNYTSYNGCCQWHRDWPVATNSASVALRVRVNAPIKGRLSIMW
ncbi:MAG: hypothetical protein ACI9WS_000421 [Paraglaciecola psychrophila]|jgi:hypothetical protein